MTIYSRKAITASRITTSLLPHTNQMSNITTAESHHLFSFIGLSLPHLYRSPQKALRRSRCLQLRAFVVFVKLNMLYPVSHFALPASSRTNPPSFPALVPLTR